MLVPPDVLVRKGKGNTIYMQASQMRHADFAMLDVAIKGRSTVCLKEVICAEGKSFTAEPPGFAVLSR